MSHDEDFWTSTFTSTFTPTGTPTSIPTGTPTVTPTFTPTQPSPFEYYSHFCVSNLQNTFNPFVTTGAPLICLNEENHPFLMGIADGPSYYQRYDKTETAFEWIDGIISGSDIRKVSEILIQVLFFDLRQRLKLDFNHIRTSKDLVQ